jgi:hypothetical protein
MAEPEQVPFGLNAAIHTSSVRSAGKVIYEVDDTVNTVVRIAG